MNEYITRRIVLYEIIHKLMWKTVDGMCESLKNKNNPYDTGYAGGDRVFANTLVAKIKTDHFRSVSSFGGRYRIRTYHLHNVNVAL